MLRKLLFVTLALFLVNISPLKAQETLGFEIRSVDMMKQTQDRVCDPPSEEEIHELVWWAKKLNATHVAISTPYDDPLCGSSISLTLKFVSEIRRQGMNVWFRQKFLSFEGFYDVSKPVNPDPFAYLPLMESYILTNPELFSEGDIFTPSPEPQNGGIQGVTSCGEQGICQFASAEEFNMWLQGAVERSTEAFSLIGKNVRVGYWGFDGFVAWGDRNLDWDGIIVDDTVLATGEITVDHYPPEGADPEEEVTNMVRELRERFGEDVYICIGEWGATESQSVDYVQAYMQALLDAGITCINYWQIGPEGNEALIQNASESNYYYGLLLFEMTQYFEIIRDVFSM